MKKFKGDKSKKPTQTSADPSLTLHKEGTQPYAPAINTFIRTTKLLQEEVWIREWETRNSKHSSSD